jgi:broad specificity phosphatase PhoE
MNFLMIRHGESEGNVDPVFYTQKDDHDIALTPKGQQQAVEMLPSLIEEMGFQQHIAYYSPFRRAKETWGVCKQSKTFGQYLSWFEENPLLVERNWGDLRKSVLHKTHTKQDFAFFNRPVQGESFFDLYQRVQLFINVCRTKAEQYECPNFVLFTHGEWMKVCRMIELGMSIEQFQKFAKKTKIPNCGIWKCVL